jgi:hypothetical protein
MLISGVPIFRCDLSNVIHFHRVDPIHQRSRQMFSMFASADSPILFDIAQAPHNCDRSGAAGLDAR